MSVLYESPPIPSPSLCSAIQPSVSIMVSQFNITLTSSRPASSASCGFSLLLFSDFGHDGFAINIDSKAEICPFFDFGPGIYSFEVHVQFSTQHDFHGLAQENAHLHLRLGK